MALLDDLEKLRNDAAAAFAGVKDAAALEAARVEYLSNRGLLKGLLGRMGEIPKEQKPAVGKRANEVGTEIHVLFQVAKARLASSPRSEGASNYEALRQDRLDKLKKYKESEKALSLGSAWGSKFPESGSGKTLASIESIRKAFTALDPAKHADPQSSGDEVCLAARVILRRDQSKKLIFLTVQDQGGTIQVALWGAMLKEEVLELLRDTLDLWDIVGLTGKLAFTQKGEPTVWATSIRILSKCIAPPPDKHHGLHDKEIRYRQRYLDLIVTEETRKAFILRSKAVSGLRRFLDERGFMEVETPVLQTIPGGAAARPFETKLNALDMKMYMRIATEIPLKKLLVGGLEKVYEMGRIFRNEGIDARHNPEFTSVELYQAYGDLRDMMELTESAVNHLAETLTGSTTVTWRGKPIQLKAPWPRLNYCDLLQQHAGVSHEDISGLDRKLKEKKIDSTGLSYVDKIDGVFSKYCEEHLQDACFVINQPLEMSPLCRAHPENPKLADRFEAFVAGMELANAYTELNDPIEQELRLSRQLRAMWLRFLNDLVWTPNLLWPQYIEDERLKLHQHILDSVFHWRPNDTAMSTLRIISEYLSLEKLQHPLSDHRQIEHLLREVEKLEDPSNSVDEDFLLALEHAMPPAGGLGIGIDRLVMILAGVDSLRDVILFPLMRQEQKS